MGLVLRRRVHSWMVETFTCRRSATWRGVMNESSAGEVPLVFAASIADTFLFGFGIEILRHGGWYVASYKALRPSVSRLDCAFDEPPEKIYTAIYPVSLAYFRRVVNHKVTLHPLLAASLIIYPQALARSGTINHPQGLFPFPTGPRGWGHVL